MIIVKIKQGHNELTYEFERYNDAELLISTILGVADKRTTIEVTITDESEASCLQDKVNRLNTRLIQALCDLELAKTKLDKYEEKMGVA